MSDRTYKVPTSLVSVWDGGTEIETNATLNVITGEITNVESIDRRDLDKCERRYVVMNGSQVDVFQGEEGFEYWADIDGRYS